MCRPTGVTKSSQSIDLSNASSFVRKVITLGTQPDSSTVIMRLISTHTVNYLFLFYFFKNKAKLKGNN